MNKDDKMMEDFAEIVNLALEDKWLEIEGGLYLPISHLLTIIESYGVCNIHNDRILFIKDMINKHYTKSLNEKIEEFILDERYETLSILKRYGIF